jgi:hypothetical protein
LTSGSNVVNKKEHIPITTMSGTWPLLGKSG